MGMSASQARYLQLTARQNDVEFQAQQICQARLSLAERTELIAKRYTEKINDRHLYFNAPYTLQTGLDENGNARPLVSFGEGSFTQKRLDYYDITNTMLNDTQPGLGMRLVNTEGKVVVAALPETMPEGMTAEDYVVDATIAPNSIMGGEAYENACNYLEQKLRDGEWIMQSPNENDVDTGWSNTSYSTNNFIDDLLYEENDSAAEAEYTRDSETIKKQDKMLELRLNQLTTLQKSLDTEIDSVKKIIDKNVEGSFKTFG